MELVFFSVIIFVASVLQTSTGFGFSILAMPFLLMLFGPASAVQINLVLSLVISLALIAKIKDDINFGIMKRFITGSAAGLPVGIVLFLMADTDWLKLGISLVILVLTVLLIFKFRITQTAERDFWTGGLSGALTSSIGMPGPPILLYFSGTETSKDKLRGTTLAFYLFIYSASLVIQVIFAGTSSIVWTSALLALPLVLLGLYVGQLLHKRISENAFRLAVYVILFFTGLGLLAETWLGA